MTTLRALLNPGYEPGDGIVDDAQLIDGQWWHPVLGSDSLQYVVDNARQALAPQVAVPAEQWTDIDGPVPNWRCPMADQFPDATKMVTLSDRIALAICPDRTTGTRCEAPCDGCRRDSAAVAHEIADYFSERYGGASTTADTLYAVGTHQPEPQSEGPALSPDQEAMALAVGRELRRPDV